MPSLVAGQVAGNSRSGGSATSASLTLTLPSTVTSGNAVGIGFGWAVTAGSGSITSILDDQSNDYSGNVANISPNPDPFSGGAGGYTYLLNRVNAPKIITITIGSTLAANILIGGCVYEVTGATSVDAATTGAVTANPLVANLTTTSTNAFGIITNFCSTSNGTFTQNTGWTQDFTEAGIGTFYFSNQLTGAAGSYSLNATGGASYHNAWAALVFEGAAAAVPALAWVK